MPTLECGHPLEDARGSECVSCTAALLSARVAGEVYSLPHRETTDELIDYILARTATLLDEAGHPDAARRARQFRELCREDPG